MTDWTDMMLEGIDVLREIVAAWEEDASHDVPLALIQRARAVLRRVDGNGT